MAKYPRLNINEHEEISLGIAKGHSQRDIAASLGRSPIALSLAKSTVTLNMGSFIGLLKPSAALTD